MAGSDHSRKMNRREMLKRLGLATTIAYSAPVMLHLSAARASDSVSRPSRPSRPSRATRPSAPSVPSVPSGPVRAAPPPQLLVSVQSRSDLNILEQNGFRLIEARQIGLIGQWIGRFALPAGLTLEAARARAAQLVQVGRVETNAIYRTSEFLCEGDECAAFSMIGWSAPSMCDAAPVIGLIDTGVNPDHEAFAGQALEIIAIERAERDPAGLTHGTAIAALLIGSAQSRTPGLLPNGRLKAIDAFYSDPLGDATDAFSLVEALDRLANEGVDVINMSFAGPPSEVLAEAIQALAARDIALVAAAGNAGPRSEPLYPAAYDQVLAVTAVDGTGQVYRQAVAGDHIALAAPGVNLWTAASISGGRLRSGTSYAAPFVAAAMAVARYRDPSISVPELVEQLTLSAQNLGPEGFDPTYGWGLVRADQLCVSA